MENTGFLKIENQNELNKILDEVDCITFRFIESWCKSHNNVCNLTIGQMVALRPTKSTYFTVKRSIDFLIKNNLIYKKEIAYRTYVYTVADDEQITLFISNIDANCINAKCINANSINANCYNTLVQNAKTPYSKLLKPIIANCYNIKEYNKEYIKEINIKNSNVQSQASCTTMSNENSNQNQLVVCEPIKQENQKQTKFVKPQLEEICNYMRERGAFDPVTESESFFDYYTSNGWRVGRNPMKDWKASVRNWLKPKGVNIPQSKKQDLKKYGNPYNHEESMKMINEIFEEMKN